MSRGQGAFLFEGSTGTWDFGNGDVLHTRVTGVFNRSGINQVAEEVVGGEGIYEGATGTIHLSAFQFGPEQSAFTPLVGGFIAGVIKLN